MIRWTKTAGCFLGCALVFVSIASAQTKERSASGGPLEAHSSAQTPTVDQFRQYLVLSGVGEIWRAGWLAALENRRAAAPPYWPAAFWSDARSAMMTADIAPMVWSVYRGVYTHEQMDAANAAIRRDGVAGFTSTVEGQKFCSAWDLKEEEQKKATLDITMSTLQSVYERHAAEIRQARTEYLIAHPNYKDAPIR